MTPLTSVYAMTLEVSTWAAREFIKLECRHGMSAPVSSKTAIDWPLMLIVALSVSVCGIVSWTDFLNAFMLKYAGSRPEILYVTIYMSSR